LIWTPVRTITRVELELWRTITVGVPIKDFLKRRRDRAVGSILGYAEREIFKDLTPEQRAGLRSSVLDALNGYHDSVLDLVKAEDGVRNDYVVEVLEKVEAELRRSRANGHKVPSPT
jgi:hypothetical protein